MTEREYYHETDPAPDGRRDVYQETVINETGDPALDPVRDVRHERVVGPDGEQILRSEHVSVPSPTMRQAAMVTRAKQIIYFIFGVINVLLTIRFVLLALGASRASPFVALIYGLSRPFALPFQGIFGQPALDGSVIEWASLVGIIVYALVAYGIVRLVELIYAPARPTITRDI